MTDQPSTVSTAGTDAVAPVMGAAVAFLGPSGSFSEVASGRLTGEFADRQIPMESIINLIQAVSTGSVIGGDQRIDAGVVPIENSTEGSVGATLDTLVDHDNLVITAELDLPIEQLLVARSDLPLSEIQQIYSHPQGIAQARRFLAEHVPGAGVVPISSTSRAVELVCESDAPWAAIGSRGAAAIYGATILRDDIQEQVNVTRFVLIERRDAPLERPVSLGDETALRRRADDDPAMKTTLFFEGAGDGTPGWLVRCLSEFAFRGVNLSKIESRPLRGRLGHYRFFIDLEGSETTDAAMAAIDGLRRHCDFVRILGSYPVAADPI